MPEDKSGGGQSFLERVQAWPKNLKDYIESLRTEMRRVTWPGRKQVQATTAVVLLTIFAFGAYFKVVDEVLVKAVTSLQKAFTK